MQMKGYLQSSSLAFIAAWTGLFASEIGSISE